MLNTQTNTTTKNALMARKENHSLAREFYCDIDIYNQDLSLIWYQSWIFVGHPMEIENIGDFFIVPIGDHSLMVYRNAENEVVACHNIHNTHNSHNVFQNESVGQLSAEQLDYAKNLKSIHCATICHYIYISLADNPVDLDEFKATIQDYIAPHKLSQLKIAAQTSIIEEGNWKLVMENNRECYHCASNHPELVVTFPDSPSVVGSGEDGFSDEVVKFWENCDSLNIPCEFKIAEDNRYRVTRMPLIKDFCSYTMHGYDAVKKRIPGLEGKYVGTLLLFHYPNTWNHFLADQVISFRVLPLDVNKTLVTTKWMVNKDAVEGVDYHLEELQHVWNETNAQDKHLVEQNQWGIQSPSYQPGPYSAVHEGGVIQFIDWYCDTLKAALEQELNTATSDSVGAA